METEHLLWVGVSFAISLFLVWMVWNFFCGGGKKGDGSSGDGSDRDDDSDSFSSTHVITGGHPGKGGKRKRRFKRATMNDHSSTNENTTTDDESARGEYGEDRGKRPRRKSRRERRSSTYQYKENNYGLHDPFSEWAPKADNFRDPTIPIVHNYPKSPSAPRKLSHVQVNLS
ncbi:uncharacterized protein LOC110852373 [Folsomia candida]|uniref:Uncharacterized protein n=1 Tax=Folsomia candida TaxID=158441 RepID=A0A226E444_FOLCA|nr:uncharacterized protein LOC110852373 [Folsomia candida]OXA52363.1 hypothetical protein Fcan01_13459 [Folsomia candida]